MRPAIRAPRLASLAAPLIGLLLAGSAAAALRPVDLDVALDRPLDCGSREPSVAAIANGGFAAAWTDGATLYWRRLDPSGRPVGQPQVVDAGQPIGPEVAAGSEGGFAVAWFDAATERVLLRVAGADLQLGPILPVADAGPERGAEFNGLDVTVSPAGNVVVVWAEGGEVLLRELRPDGSFVTDPWSIDAVGTLFPSATVPALFDPTVVAGLDGAFRVFVVQGTMSPFLDRGTLRGRRVGPLLPSGGYGFVGSIRVPTTGLDHDPDAARAADGSYVVAWDGDLGYQIPVLAFPRPAIVAARFTAADSGPDDVVEVDSAGGEYGDTAIAALRDGGYALAWRSSTGAEPQRPRAFAQQLDAAGNPLDQAVPLAPATSWGQTGPALAAGPGGQILSVWQEVPDPDVVFVRCPGEQVRARLFQAACADGGTVCVVDGRFEMSLRYFDLSRGIPDQAAAGAPLTADTAYFWFGSPDNVEVIVKVLDGRALNGHYWVFYGGLTDLGFELEVRDTVTGRERVFRNLPGTMASAGVTDALPATAADALAAGVEVRAFRATGLARDAFPDSAPHAPALRALGAAEAVVTPAVTPRWAALSPPAPPGPCRDPARPGLCLNDGRFNFTVDWRAFDGTTGVGHGVPLGDDSGYFWFFHPDNVELVVKALDGRAVNGKFWIFYGALTNVEYAIGVWHVVDSVWDLPQVVYENPLGEFASVADVDAFPAPVCTCPAIQAPVCGRDGKTYGNDCQAYCVGWVDIAHPGACEGD